MAPAVQVYSYAVLGGASIQFNGSSSSFQFLNDPVTGNQWSITGETGGSGALNLNGWFSGGPWTYGTVSSIDGVESATVSAPPGNPLATLSIYDNNGHYATANVIWVDISDYLDIGGMNGGLAINLTGLSYTGSNPDLLSFFSAPSGMLNLSFQFIPAMTLQQLTLGTGPYNTSFSGSLTPSPEPTSLLIFAGGFTLIGCRAFFKRRARNCQKPCIR